MGEFSGKTVMVTGSNRGIGKKTAELFAHEGANLICCLRTGNSDFDLFCTSLSDKYGVSIQKLYFDLSDENSVKTTLSDFIKQKPQIDVLVNNAGIATGSLLQMTSMKELHNVFQINFFSQVLITQMVSKIMIRQKKGVIINMGSVAGLENFAGYTSYGSSKAALMMFTRTIARELAPHNIRVNNIAPGLTETGMAVQMEAKASSEMVDRTDLKRMGNTDEIANAILFVASDKASFITGQTIRVDGGM